MCRQNGDHEQIIYCITPNKEYKNTLTETILYIEQAGITYCIKPDRDYTLILNQTGITPCIKEARATNTLNRLKMKFLIISALILWLLLGVGCVPPPFPPGLQGGYGPYSTEAVQYFTEIAFGPETDLMSIHNLTARPVIHKWNSNIRIQLHGSYTPEDEQELTSIISELKELTGLSIKRVNQNANIHIHIIHKSKFKDVMPAYKGVPQIGIFYIKPAADHSIQKATILIKDELVGEQRRHILREELTQSLGLPKDSHAYTDSIFQQSKEFSPTQYAFIDKEIIHILYDPSIRPGMNQQQALQALQQASQV